MSARPVHAALLAVALASGSCAKGGGLGDLGVLKDLMPKIRFDRFEVKNLTFEQIDTVFILEIDNPYPVGIDLGSFSWGLQLAGNDFLSGKDKKGSNIEASGTSKLRIPVSLGFQQIFATVTDLQGKDSVPFRFSGHVGVNTPLGQLKLPYQAKGDMPVIKPPKISFQKIRLDKVDVLGGKATIAVDLGLAHQGAATMLFKAFDYDLTIGGKKVLEGLVDDLAEVPAGKTRTVSLPVTVNLISVGETIFRAITGGGKLDVGLDARLKIGTPFGDLPLSINETGNLRVER